jgi:hypothetical protein
VTHRVYRKVLFTTCATALAIAETAASGAVGRAATPGPLPAATTAGVPPSWLGDVPGLGGVAPDVTPSGVPVNLSGCTVTLDLFKDDRARVRPFVPGHYELGTNAYFGPGVATIAAGALACDAAAVDGGAPARTVLSFIAVQVLADLSKGNVADALWDPYNRSTLNVLPSASWYLIATQTDSAALARRLDAAGLPVEDVSGLVYHTDYGTAMKSDLLTVPSQASGYRLATTTMVPDCCLFHNHDWAFLYDGVRGTVGLFNHLHGMIDSACGYQASALVHAAVPSCGGTVTAQPGSRMATFLGAPSRETTVVFNHPKAHQPGYITLLEPSTAR